MEETIIMKDQLYNIIKDEIYRKLNNNISQRLVTTLELQKLVSSTNIPKSEINVLNSALFEDGRIIIGRTCNHAYVAIPEVSITY